jgi:hypothetical protein
LPQTTIIWFQIVKFTIYVLAAFVIPIVVNDQVVAVVAFYAPDVRQEDDALIKHARNSMRCLFD